MTHAERFTLMARYNAWMNERLYTLCADLSDDDRRAERGAFFGSIHATLNHIQWLDEAFLCRFTGEPASVADLGAELYPDFGTLREARAATDARLLDWMPDMTDEWLAGTIAFASAFDGKNRTVPRWAMLTQLFNHQTHHRGQITTLLSQMGLDLGITDIPFLPEFEDRG